MKIDIQKQNAHDGSNHVSMLVCALHVGFCVYVRCLCVLVCISACTLRLHVHVCLASVAAHARMHVHKCA